MEQKELQEALLEKLSSIEKQFTSINRCLYMIAFSMYIKQTEAGDDVQWDEFDTAKYESYLDEGMKLFDLDKLYDKIRKKGKE